MTKGQSSRAAQEGGMMSLPLNTGSRPAEARYKDALQAVIEHGWTDVPSWDERECVAAMKIINRMQRIANDALRAQHESPVANGDAPEESGR